MDIRRIYRVVSRVEMVMRKSGVGGIPREGGTSCIAHAIVLFYSTHIH